MLFEKSTLQNNKQHELALLHALRTQQRPLLWVLPVFAVVDTRCCRESSCGSVFVVPDCAHFRPTSTTCASSVAWRSRTTMLPLLPWQQQHISHRRRRAFVFLVEFPLARPQSWARSSPATTATAAAWRHCLLRRGCSPLKTAWRQLRPSSSNNNTSTSTCTSGSDWQTRRLNRQHLCRTCPFQGCSQRSTTANYNSNSSKNNANVQPCWYLLKRRSRTAK